jgi:bacterioferritin
VTDQDSDAVLALNTMLMIELTALNQYFLHSKLCAHWGYDRLAAKFRELSMEEMRDAETYTDRILQLDGMPNFQKLGPVKIGSTPAEQLALARDAETSALAALHQGIVACEAAGDVATAGMFREAALEEMTHLDWAQSQLRLLDQLGEINYLTTQVVA